jgi:hypothetical protein
MNRPNVLSKIFTRRGFLRLGDPGEAHTAIVVKFSRVSLIFKNKARTRIG